MRPASMMLFDLLADTGEDVTGRPLRERRARLARLLAGAPAALALCPQTADVDVARLWFDEFGVTGAEGLVVDPESSPTPPTAGRHGSQPRRG
ncbi:hypothetical protein BG844_23280 [Couchioplanes caeruleus subsp. caeruleus]|uniref:ATP-dependent DNA ligase family profile domain-containing protein n=1 Tax=Couchioplanes caeruleus subsp. caeruleus TaxID=56427 RepID=A0A1K0GLR6_9ACTN|nr:hypothetical protein BG844_23280 [Couchioplanes caeruleus subsp. caeruleus]